MADTGQKGKLDREARVLLRYLEFPMGLSVKNFPLGELRKYWDHAAKLMGTSEPIEKEETLWVPGPSGPIETRIYTPFTVKSPSPTILWIHGGAFIAGSLNSADAICRAIASHSGITVVSVNYRLAPEYNLYAGREDCLSVLQWLALHGDEIGIDAQRLAVGGDSAGGNLAAALALKCQQLGEPFLRLQVLIYPITDFINDYPSRHGSGYGCFLTPEILEYAMTLIREKVNFKDPWISPMEATTFKGIAPGLVLTAGFDMLRDEGIAYAERLRAEKIPVEHLHYAGQFHGFLNFDTVLRQARDALKRVGETLSTAMASGEERAGVMDSTIEIADSASSSGIVSDFFYEGAVGSLMMLDWLSQGGKKLAHLSLPNQLIPLMEKNQLMNQLEHLRDLLSKRDINVTEDDIKK